MGVSAAFVNCLPVHPSTSHCYRGNVSWRSHDGRLKLQRRGGELRRPVNGKVVRAMTMSSTGNKSVPDVSVEKPSEIVDGPFGKFAIALFRRIMTKEIGWESRRPGYDGLVEEMRMLLAKAPVHEQQRVVFHTLNTLFQAPHGPEVFRKYFASQPQLNAMITPIFFRWLVGPCSTNTPAEHPGYHGVYIEKCRFLDESGCKGLCVNMCQQPTQRFFTDTLNLPVRMTPDYETSSCQMTFGLAPLPVAEDPAVTGDCLQGCKMKDAFKKRGDLTCYSNEEADPN